MSDTNQFTQWDQSCMRLALAKAAQAAAAGEVPVGSVCSINDQSIVSLSGNSPIASCDPTAHAEINALRLAAKECQNYRLPGVTLYVTLEPCAMCVGAIIHARIDRLVYGALDPRTGSVESVRELLAQQTHNHRVKAIGGLYAQEASALLKEFFQARRHK